MTHLQHDSKGAPLPTSPGSGIFEPDLTDLITGIGRLVQKLNALQYELDTMYTFWTGTEETFDTDAQTRNKLAVFETTLQALAAWLGPKVELSWPLSGVCQVQRRLNRLVCLAAVTFFSDLESDLVHDFAVSVVHDPAWTTKKKKKMNLISSSSYVATSSSSWSL